MLMGWFYETEPRAFTKEIVIKSFEEVGLSPWNPPLIMKNARTHSPVKASPNKDDIMNDLSRTVRMAKSKKVDTLKCHH